MLGAWPRFGETNPRNTIMYDYLVEHSVDVADIKNNPFEILKIKIIHLHWPEKAFSTQNTIVSWCKIFLFTVLIGFLRVRGVKIYYTVHNDYKKDISRKYVQRLFEIIFLQNVDLFLIPSRKSLNSLPKKIIRNKKWKLLPLGLYPRLYDRKDVPQKKYHLIIGRLTRKKNIVATINRICNVQTETLRVVGSPEDEGYAAELRSLSELYSNLELDFRFLTDDEFQLEIASAQSVIIDYDDGNLNSGVATMAMTLNTPLFISDREMRKDVSRLYGVECLDVRKFPSHQVPTQSKVTIEVVAARLMKVLKNED